MTGKRSHCSQNDTSKSTTPRSSSHLQARSFTPSVQQEGESTELKAGGPEAEAPVQPSGFSFANIAVGDGAPPPSLPSLLQAKLTIGQPNDPYEQEADRVAREVVQQIHSPQVQPEEEELQMKAVVQAQTIEEEELQMKAVDGQSFSGIRLAPTVPPISLISRAGGGVVSGEASSEFEMTLNRARSGGESLAPQTKGLMESAMGVDFSGVKVHTDAVADQLSQSIQARAFTTGQDVFFKQGEYQPGSRGGQELLAHELTHVVQQSGGAVQRWRLSGGEATGELTSAISPIQESVGPDDRRLEDSSPFVQSKTATTSTHQKKPDILKTGTEYLSDYTMDAVKRQPDQVTGFQLHVPQLKIPAKSAIPQDLTHLVQQHEGSVMRSYWFHSRQHSSLQDQEQCLISNKESTSTNQIQPLRDGFYNDGTKVESNKIRFSASFQSKHFAKDVADSKTVTHKRFTDGNMPQAMANGKIGNTTATEANWKNAVDSSEATIPDQKEWEGNLDIKITGWSSTWTDGDNYNTVESKDEKRTVGGYMDQQGGDVTIDHVGN